MIALAVCWLFLFRASSVTGDLLLRGLGAPVEDDDHWFLAFWTGLLALGAFVLLAALALPTPYAAAVLLLALLPRASAPSLAPPRAFWAIAAAMTFTSSSPVRLYDTALYHQPLIEWLSSEGLAPGLGLVHYRFGFTSSWLALTSMFNVGPLQDRCSALVTGLAIAVCLAQWVHLYRRNNFESTRFYLAALPPVLAFSLLESAIVSPSPNTGVALAVLTGIWLLVRSPAHPAAFAVAAGSLAVKLSAAPLAAVAFFRAPRRVWWAAALIVPFVLANYQTTGCPLFPAALLCSDAPEGLPPQQVRAIAHETLNWARYAGFYPPGASYFQLEWLPRYLSLSRNAVMAALTALSLLALVLQRRFTLPIAAAALGAAYVYAAAPDPRFGAGFLFALPALVLPALPLPRLSRRALTVTIVLVLTLGAWTGTRLADITMPDPRNEFTSYRLLVPAEAWTPDATTTFLRHGSVFHAPVATDRCGAAPRPCTPYAPLPTLHREGRAWKR